MSIEIQIFLLDLASWMAFPILGLLAGLVVGFAYRKEGIRVDVNNPSIKSNWLVMGAYFAVPFAAMIAWYSYRLHLAMGGETGALDYAIKEAVVFMAYVIVADFTATHIANRQ